SKSEYASIRRYTTLEPKTFGEKKGVHSWELTVAIPLMLMGLDPNRMPKKILANFCKCADATLSPHYLSWSPINSLRPDFHKPEFFGELIFL
ncbi:MAG: hypothetical protein LBI58_04965, partial [Tannerellaceae bacterium]|nr:hypothetical protein [Tannerellaceae bacterium]